MKKTSEGIREGSVLHLRVVAAGDSTTIPPAELEWAKKWVVTEIISDHMLRIISTKTKREIVVIRSDTNKYVPAINKELWFVFVATSDYEFIKPQPARYSPKKTSVIIDDNNALEFLLQDKRHSNLNRLVNSLLVQCVEKRMKEIVGYAEINFYLKTGTMPTYMILYSSVISRDLNFLMSLLKEYGGVVMENQMRWVAFEADDLDDTKDAND